MPALTDLVCSNYLLHQGPGLPCLSKLSIISQCYHFDSGQKLALYFEILNLNDTAIDEFALRFPYCTEKSRDETVEWIVPYLLELLFPYYVRDTLNRGQK